jgi:hypothetical protein
MKKAEHKVIEWIHDAHAVLAILPGVFARRFRASRVAECAIPNVTAFAPVRNVERRPE